MTSLPILLPDGYIPLVSVGDVVTPKQIVAKKKVSDHTVTINISEELSLPPQKTGKTIQINPGEEINPGDVIAVRSGFLGMGKQTVISHVKGKILSYQTRTGDMTIQVGEPETNDGDDGQVITSPIDGTVSVCDNEKIVVETKTNALIAHVGLGESTKAELFVLKDDHDTVPLHALSTEIIGKIVLAPTLDRAGLTKTIGMEAKGIVLTDLADHDREYLQEKQQGFPVLVVSKDDYQKLTTWQGKTVYIDGEQKSIVLLHE